MPCSGIRIAYNMFKDNFGCYKYGGSMVSIHCTADIVRTPTGTIDDDQTQKIKSLKLYPELMTDFFNFDYDGYLLSNRSQVAQIPYQWGTVEVDVYRVSLDHNTYTRNYAGFAESLLYF